MDEDEQSKYYLGGENAGDASVEESMASGKGHQGFASMKKDRQREIASKGGRAAHQKGTAHEWTSEEAREAGRKGGLSRKTREEVLEEEEFLEEAA